MTPVTALAADRRDAETHVRLDQDLAQRQRQLAQLDGAVDARRKRPGLGAGRPGTPQRLDVEAAVSQRLPVSEDDGGAGKLAQTDELGERSATALDDAEVG